MRKSRLRSIKRPQSQNWATYKDGVLKAAASYTVESCQELYRETPYSEGPIRNEGRAQYWLHSSAIAPWFPKAGTRIGQSQDIEMGPW